jgi:hypothetical protein
MFPALRRAVLVHDTRPNRDAGVVGGGLAVSLHRPRFVIEGLGDVERVGRLVPDVALLLVFTP